VGRCRHWGKQDAAAAILCGLALSSCSVSDPDPPYVDFVVSVAGETFVLRATDPETIRLARENLEGRNPRFPIGRLNRSNGGFNAPWSWSLDPDDVRMTEVAIEVCDGRPSYVEGHLSDYPTYCPWGARVISERASSS
jgi:hypothetical protein